MPLVQIRKQLASLIADLSQSAIVAARRSQPSRDVGPLDRHDVCRVDLRQEKIGLDKDRPVSPDGLQGHRTD